MWPRRRRLYPVELDHHLTSPTSRESHARTHARTRARARKHTGHGLENASTCSCRPGQVGHAVSCAGRARATSHRRKGVERRDHRGGTARDTKGVSGTRGRAMRIEDQGRSCAFRE